MARGKSNPLFAIVAAGGIALVMWLLYARFGASLVKIVTGAVESATGGVTGVGGRGGNADLSQYGLTDIYTAEDAAQVLAASLDPDRPRLHH